MAQVLAKDGTLGWALAPTPAQNPKVPVGAGGPYARAVARAGVRDYSQKAVAPMGSYP